MSTVVKLIFRNFITGIFFEIVYGSMLNGQVTGRINELAIAVVVEDI
jgi:hypothetical protein